MMGQDGGVARSPRTLATLAGVLVAARIANGLLVTTYFDADEYWQSLEIAYCLAFGSEAKCHKTWEWQDGVQIRGYAHPLLFAGFYRLLVRFDLDSRWAIAYGPRVLSGAFAAVGDLATLAVGTRLLGREGGLACMLCQVFNWFYFYTCVRTYSNSVEAVLTIAALAFWPLGPEASTGRAASKTLLGLILAATAVILRPSAAAFWIYLGLRHLALDFSGLKSRAAFVLLQVAPVGLVSVLVMLAIDRLGYGAWTFVPYNFFRVNVLENVSAEYGVHAWHWYVTECIPAVTGTWLPAIAFGVRESLRPHRRRARVLTEFVMWGFAVLSLNGHKELRFALPLVGPLSVLAGLGVLSMPTGRKQTAYICFACVSNLIAAGFLSRFHQAAPIPLMDELARLEGANTSHFVDFYTRCHATPYWSHVHGAPISRMRFLDCSPAVPALAKIPSMSKHVLQGIEEEDDFFARPLEALGDRLATQRPTRLVFTTEKVSEGVLAAVGKRYRYAECARFRHTFDIDYVLLCDDI